MRLFNASAVVHVQCAGLGASQKDGSHRTCLLRGVLAEMQPVPHLMPEKAATRDARVGKWKDTLRREGHSEDIAAPEAAPAGHRQAVISAPHLAGSRAAWVAPTSYLPGESA